jgi:hypothetical protein
VTHTGLIMTKSPLIGVLAKKNTSPTRRPEFLRLASYISTSGTGRTKQGFTSRTCVQSIGKFEMSPISQDYTVLLPPETLLHIASYIDKPSDLISLAHTNSTLRSYAVARLYSRICLYRWSAKTIDVLDHLAKYSSLPKCL